MLPSVTDDQVAIATALAALSRIFDTRAWDRLDEVLTPDVEAYGVRGRQAVIDDNLRRYLGGCGPTQHLLGNYEITVTGDEATSVTQARVYHQGAGERADRFWECLGEYHDAWVRTPAGWRMTRRTFDVRIAVGDMEVLQPG